MDPESLVLQVIRGKSSYEAWTTLNMIFQDNDKSTTNCASDTASGWWFNDCAGVNLNGVYHGARLEKDKFDVKTGKRIDPTPLDGVFWNSNNRKWDSLRMTKMFIAPKNVQEYPCLYET